jgi:5-methyltetrahydrofolate--homocysteine methyltransferase
MKNILERIGAGEILVADGAMGTMLYERGFDISRCVEAVNLSHPEILEEIARLYLEAGAEIIQTNTFGASPLKLSMYSLENKTEEMIQKAVSAVRKAINGKAYVSGSCGPSGKMLKPYGDIESEVMFESFKRQMKSLIESGVDIICIETMTDIAEATLAIRAAREVSSSIPIMTTMTFDATPRGFFTIMGTDIKKAGAELEKAGANIIGSNCGNGIENMVGIAKEFKKESTLPLIIQSNAGLPVLKEGRLIYPETPEFMAEKAMELISLGVSIIGGCCGTTPAHIAAIRKLVDSRNSRQSK